MTTMRTLLKLLGLFFVSFGSGFFVFEEFRVWFVRLYQMMSSASNSSAFQHEMAFLTTGPLLVATLAILLYAFASYMVFITRFRRERQFEIGWSGLITVWLGSVFGCIWKALHIMAGV